MAELKQEYARALFDLSKEENKEDVILADVRALKALVDGTPEYVKLMSAPNVKKEERTQLLDEAFRGKIHPYTLNFMKILVENGCFHFIGGCCDEFVKLYNEKNNIEVVTVFSPVALSDAQKERLKQNLSLRLKKTIELHEKIDESLIGGIRLSLDGEMIDGSIKSRLDEIKDLLGSTVL